MEQNPDVPGNGSGGSSESKSSQAGTNSKKHTLSEIISQSVEHAVKRMRTIKNPAHSMSHVHAVFELTEKLCDAYPEANRDLIRFSVMWHDVGVLEVGIKQEERSARRAKEDLLARGASEDYAESVYITIAQHDCDSRPPTIEGKILRDADKLDFLNTSRWLEPIRRKNWDGTLGVGERQFLKENIPRLREDILALEPARDMYEDMFPKFVRVIGRLARIHGKTKDEVMALREIKDFHDGLRSAMPQYKELDDRIKGR